MRGKENFWTKSKIRDIQSQDEVPLYRSYGVTRNYRPFVGAIGNGAIVIVALWIICLFVMVLSFALVAFLFYGQLLLVTVFYLLAGGILFAVLTRTIRKRMKFRRRLKKLCRKEGYRLEYRRSLLSSFSWREGQIDFLLNTRSTLYEVRFLTLKKYNGALLFESEDSFQYTTYPYRNLLTTIFNVQPRTRTYSLDQTPATVRGSRTAERVLLINPVCREMFYKDRDGSRVATGSGAELFGYTVFTATGFLETVKRRDEQMRYGAPKEREIGH